MHKDILSECSPTDTYWFIDPEDKHIQKIYDSHYPYCMTQKELSFRSKLLNTDLKQFMHLANIYELHHYGTKELVEQSYRFLPVQSSFQFQNPIYRNMKSSYFLSDTIGILTKWKSQGHRSAFVAVIDQGGICHKMLHDFSFLTTPSQSLYHYEITYKNHSITVIAPNAYEAILKLQKKEQPFVDICFFDSFDLQCVDLPTLGIEFAVGYTKIGMEYRKIIASRLDNQDLAASRQYLELQSS